MNLSEITDPADPRLSDFVDVRDADRRRRSGTFLAEGPILVERLLDSRLEVRALLCAPGMLRRLEEVLVHRDVEVFMAPAALLSRTVGFDFHRGVVASALRPDELDVDAPLDSSRTLVALEAVNDPENLGAIFRSAQALGVDGVVLDQACADPLYRRSVRVSMGATFTLPFARADRDPVDRLRGQGFSCLALTPDASADSIETLELRPLERVAVLLGSEGGGLRPETIRRADRRIRIPIRRESDSLNVGHAAAIAFHEIGRRRP